MKHKVHKYKKVKLGKEKDYLVYACQLPGCNHYITPELLIGKLGQCYRCNETFLVSADMVRKGREMLKLHCKDCTKSKGTKDAKTIDIEALLSNLGVGE